MKNQYFGDINDYRKYGLLRALQSTGDGSLLVTWMLTPDLTMAAETADSGPTLRLPRSGRTMIPNSSPVWPTCFARHRSLPCR
jgi:hypothetical protein